MSVVTRIEIIFLTPVMKKETLVMKNKFCFPLTGNFCHPDRKVRRESKFNLDFFSVQIGVNSFFRKIQGTEICLRLRPLKFSEL